MAEPPEQTAIPQILRAGNEKSGISFTKRESRLQSGNLAYKTGLSFTNRDSWITTGTLGLLFTACFETGAYRVDKVGIIGI